MHHDDAAKDWGALGYRALTPSSISYKPQINSSTVQGERTGSVALREGDTTGGGTNIDGEAQRGGRNGRARNRADELARGAVQVAVPAESRAFISTHSFRMWGATVMFYTRIFNLNAGSYLHMITKKYLAKAEKDKKELYLQACL